jgi:hypothetical protein
LRALLKVKFFVGTCSCNFPNVPTQELGTNITLFEQEELGFNVAEVYLGTVRAPEVDLEFPGNQTVCNDPQYASSLFLEAPEATVSWVEIWFTSGIVASLFAKLVAANFGFSLYAYVDPLGKANGTYEAPPDHVPDVAAMDRMRHEKIGIIRSGALRGVIVWGLLFQGVVINLIVSASDNRADLLAPVDLAVGLAVIGVALVGVPLLGWRIIRGPRRVVIPTHTMEVHGNFSF